MGFPSGSFMVRNGSARFFGVVFGLLTSSVVFASPQGLGAQELLPRDGSQPDCIIDGTAAKIDNARIINFKRTTKNQFKDRGYVDGVVTRLFDRNGDHKHFEIRIAAGSDSDVFEIIFNSDFGNPAVSPGDQVRVCGDYITSYAKANGYDASPSKAILHWVHENSRGGDHPDGFVIVNSHDVYGYGQKGEPVELK